MTTTLSNSVFEGKKSFWQACLLKDYTATVRASDTAQRSGVHTTQLFFQGNPAASAQPARAAARQTKPHCSVGVKSGRNR